MPDQLVQREGDKKELVTVTEPAILINKLSFTHFIELIKIDGQLKRYFFETETIKNSWSVRQLQRAINSMFFERIGLSTEKGYLKEKLTTEIESFNTDLIFKNPYILEFLQIDEKSEYSESDLEKSIIDHLQAFLMEMGRGFCFEARQKRITFDNTHYYIDLVFYHRILKCHVLIDLKMGEFSHADAGQMNVYLNYYREMESESKDNPPIGIILCAGKNDSLVKYATAGLTQKILATRYLLKLPKESELLDIIKKEQEKFLSPNVS